MLFLIVLLEAAHDEGTRGHEAERLASALKGRIGLEFPVEGFGAGGDGPAGTLLFRRTGVFSFLSHGCFHHHTAGIRGPSPAFGSEDRGKLPWATRSCSRRSARARCRC